MATRGKTSELSIEIPELKTGRIEVGILGETPFISNRMSEKAKRELLAPRGRKTLAEKQGSMKHEPLSEYRASVYRLHEADAPTVLAIPAAMFKGAISTGALDTPGATKAQIGRLVYVEGFHLPLYGLPKLLMSVVRSADMNRTPDIRTRAIVPRWAALVTIRYVEPLLTAQSVLNLLAAGGRTAGVGDWRQEKGKGNYGLYRLVNTDDAEFQSILTLGREAQHDALEQPECVDADSQELLDWYLEEMVKRGRSGQSAPLALAGIAANGKE